MIRIVLFCFCFVVGCGHSDEPVGPSSRLVKYVERDQIGLVIVEWWPDIDCEIRVLEGPSLDSLSSARHHCDSAELQRGEDLLSAEAWATYEDSVSSSAGMGGSGGAIDARLRLKGTAMDPDLPDQSDAYEVGKVQVNRTYIEDETSAPTLVFDADSTGPEAELIAYFRGLRDRYGP